MRAASPVEPASRMTSRLVSRALLSFHVAESAESTDLHPDPGREAHKQRSVCRRKRALRPSGHLCRDPGALHPQRSSDPSVTSVCEMSVEGTVACGMTRKAGVPWTPLRPRGAAGCTSVPWMSRATRHSHPGQRVVLTFEAGEQDGYGFRA